MPKIDLNYQRLLVICNLIWESRWASDAEDYQTLVGLAAEVSSGNFDSLDTEMAVGSNPD